MQRAENLSVLNCNNILELCVGPSLQDLKLSYNKLEMAVHGNDIDPRWEKYFPQGSWIIGDCLLLDYSPFDAVVFAPPLSKNCSGRRKDSLSILNVIPRYIDFLKRAKEYKKIFVLVLPGRTLSVKTDKEELYYLLDVINNIGFNVEICPLKCSKNKINKYIDLYLTPQTL